MQYWVIRSSVSSFTSLSLHCSLRSRAPLRSFVHSLTHSGALGKEVLYTARARRFDTVSTLSAMTPSRVEAEAFATVGSA